MHAWSCMIIMNKFLTVKNYISSTTLREDALLRFSKNTHFDTKYFKIVKHSLIEWHVELSFHVKSTPITFCNICSKITTSARRGPLLGVGQRNNLYCYLSFILFLDLLPWNTKAGITVQFIQEIVDKLKSHILENFNRNSKVIKFKSPDELIKEIDCELNNEGSSLGDLLEVTCKALEHSVKTGMELIMSAKSIQHWFIYSWSFALL